MINGKTRLLRQDLSYYKNKEAVYVVSNLFSVTGKNYGKSLKNLKDQSVITMKTIIKND